MYNLYTSQKHSKDYKCVAETIDFRTNVNNIQTSYCNINGVLIWAESI